MDGACRFGALARAEDQRQSWHEEKRSESAQAHRGEVLTARDRSDRSIWVGLPHSGAVASARCGARAEPPSPVILSAPDFRSQVHDDLCNRITGGVSGGGCPVISGLWRTTIVGWRLRSRSGVSATRSALAARALGFRCGFSQWVSTRGQSRRIPHCTSAHSDTAETSDVTLPSC